ncbi:outer membrane protein assembly factor BamD [Sphingobacterium spiritivorum]|nr:outer membrane protein assembly factor BamD [Sphingobacterium spiritivorum]WQD34049.1 outer membrane protein assembly factor BamD [Sphingobacterium spiritivorum]
MAVVAGLLLIVFISGCKSKFEKLRASNNLALKYQEAVKFYEKKKYTKALALFDDLMQRYRGQAEAEDLYYYTAYTNYRLKDYTSARYHFKQFAQTFPNSAKAEECRFMTAYCFYLDSPRSSLDQENTRKAIDELQLFVNLYPESEKAKEAADLIQQLRDKLEKKAFSNAKLYYDMGLNDDYKAAVIALENVLKEYPDTKYAEEINYLIIKAQFRYAEKSTPRRQEERYSKVIDYYQDFVDDYPESKHRKEVDDIRKDSETNMAVAIKRWNEIKKSIEEQERELGVNQQRESTEEVKK